MNQTLRIGLSVIEGFSAYADKVSLDDESEYFPILKVLIAAIANTDKENGKKVRAELMAFAKKRYIKTWIKNTKEDDGDCIDIKREEKEASKFFDYLIKRK